MGEDNRSAIPAKGDNRNAIPATGTGKKDQYSLIWRIFCYILLFYLLHLLILVLPFAHTGDQCIDQNEFDMQGIDVDSHKGHNSEVNNVVTKFTPYIKIIINNSWSSIIKNLDKNIINELDDCDVVKNKNTYDYDIRCSKLNEESIENPQFNYCISEKGSNDKEHRVDYYLDHTSSQNYLTQKQCKFHSGYGVYLSFFDFCKTNLEKEICKGRLTSDDCKGEDKGEECEFKFIPDCVKDIRFHLFHDDQPYFLLSGNDIDHESQNFTTDDKKECINGLIVKNPQNNEFYFKENLGVRLTFVDYEKKNQQTNFLPNDNNSGMYRVILGDGFRYLSGSSKEISISGIINKIEAFIFGRSFDDLSPNNNTSEVKQGSSQISSDDGIIGLFYKNLISNNIFRNLVLIFMSIYISFFSLSALLGIIDIKKKEFASLFVKIALATTFLLSTTAWQWYNQYIVFFFRDVLNYFVEAISNITNGDKFNFTENYHFKVDSIFNDVISINGFWKIIAISFKALFAIIHTIVIWASTLFIGPIVGLASDLSGGWPQESIFSPIDLLWIVFMVPVLVFLILAFLYILANIAFIYVIAILEIGFALAIAPLFLLFNLLKVTEKMFTKWINFILVRFFSIIFLCLVSFYFIDQARFILYNDIFQEICIDTVNFFSIISFSFFKAENYPEIINFVKFAVYLFLLHFFSSRTTAIATQMVSFGGTDLRRRGSSKIESTDNSSGFFSEANPFSEKSVLRNMAGNFADQLSNPITRKLIKEADKAVSKGGFLAKTFKNIRESKSANKRFLPYGKSIKDKAKDFGGYLGDITDGRHRFNSEVYDVFKAREQFHRSRGLSRDDAVKNAINDVKNSKYLEKFKKQKDYKLHEKAKKKKDNEKFKQFLEKSLRHHLKVNGYVDDKTAESELEYMNKVFGDNMVDKDAFKEEIVNKIEEDRKEDGSNQEEIDKRIQDAKDKIDGSDRQQDKINQQQEQAKQEARNDEEKKINKNIEAARGKANYLQSQIDSKEQQISKLDKSKDSKKIEKIKEEISKLESQKKTAENDILQQIKQKDKL